MLILKVTRYFNSIERDIAIEQPNEETATMYEECYFHGANEYIHDITGHDCEEHLIHAFKITNATTLYNALYYVLDNTLITTHGTRKNVYDIIKKIQFSYDTTYLNYIQNLNDNVAWLNKHPDLKELITHRNYYEENCGLIICDNDMSSLLEKNNKSLQLDILNYLIDNKLQVKTEWFDLSGSLENAIQKHQIKQQIIELKNSLKKHTQKLQREQKSINKLQTQINELEKGLSN